MVAVSWFVVEVVGAREKGLWCRVQGVGCGLQGVGCRAKIVAGLGITAPSVRLDSQVLTPHRALRLL